MRIKSIISILLCLSIIFLASGIANMAYATPDSNNNSETNVIKASDAGGGDLSQRDMLWIILGFVVLILLIVVLR
jgi:hypothetical protein